MPLTQQNRDAAIGPVGSYDEDKLVLHSFTGREELGRLSEFEAELLSEEFDVDFDKVIGENVTVRLETSHGGTRYFNGIVSRFVQNPAHNQYASYRATIVPWLWLLTRTSDCRIFQGKTVPEILAEVFNKYKMEDVEKELTGTYTAWENCVQYRETDFNFVSRLMEQEGIYYYFRHEKGKHKLVLADSPDKHVAFKGYDDIHYRPPGEGSDPERIRDWVIHKELSTGTFVHTDFDFENPKKNLCTEPATINREHKNSKFEIFDYPGEYSKPPDGKSWAQIRIQELQARHELLHGQGDPRGVAAGCTFTLQDFGREDQKRKYLVVSVNHSINMSGYETGGGGGGGDTYHCSFTVMPATENFRPARITPKPLIQGPQTAIVAGPKGDEICTDKYGRVKVKFHWDRYSKGDDTSSCWVRVSQAWAGKKWGAIYIPRIGQEVTVEFIEGDPDWPIITGRVYNGECMPPYDLPNKATLSGLKSNSSKGGQGFNEIRFEDKKGSEQIFIHGEKNMDVRVKNDRFEWIGNTQHLVVKKTKFEHVENNRHEKVDADHIEKIGKDRHLHVSGKEAKHVEGSLSLTVDDDVIEVFKANHSEQTTADYYLKGDDVIIEGMSSVTIMVGQSFIAIESDGITISTPGTLEFESDGALSAKSEQQVELEGPMIDISAQSEASIDGGTVSINGS